MYKNAISFLQVCKQVVSNPTDMLFVQVQIQMLRQGNWAAELHGQVLNALAYFYCYRTGLTVEQLVQITTQLADVFDMDGNLDVLHLQTREDLDDWIKQLQQM